MTYALVTFVGLLVLTCAAVVGFTAWTARRVGAALPPPGRFVEVGGSRIHYLERGRGPALLLIHGLGGCVRTFTHSLVERLAGEYRVVVMERPGSGDSTRARGACARVNSQAETVSAFIGALGLDRPVLVGHSLGGAVASKIPGVELVEGGHMLPLTAPDLVAAFVRRVAARAFGAGDKEGASAPEREVAGRG